MTWWNHKSIVNLLSECCICRTQASIMFPAVQTISRGEFVGLGDDSLRLELYPEAENEFRVDCLCCVTFNHDFRPHVFLTLVLKHVEELPGKPYELVLEIPPQILVEKRRIAFRIPVTSDSNLSVQLRTEDGGTWTATARNVSVAGMLIEFTGGHHPELAVGSTVNVLLQLANNEVEIQAEVKRRDDCSYGLYFPGVVSGNSLNPPTDLAAIIKVLEQYWYQNKQLLRTTDFLESSPV